MDRRVKIFITVAACLFAVIGLVLMGIAAEFVITTIPSGRLAAYCADNNSAERTKGEFEKATVSGFKGYSFYYVKKNAADKPQELFVFREKAFLGDKSTGRWKFQDMVTEKDHPIGMTRITLDEKEKTEGLVFFSSNPEKITKCVYTLKMNGVEEKHTKKLEAKGNFCFGITDLSAEKVFVKAEFFDQKGELLLSY